MWKIRTCLIYDQYHGCWWPGSARSQVISRRDIDLVYLEYSRSQGARVKHSVHKRLLSRHQHVTLWALLPRYVRSDDRPLYTTMRALYDIVGLPFEKLLIEIKAARPIACRMLWVLTMRQCTQWCVVGKSYLRQFYFIWQEIYLKIIYLKFSKISVEVISHKRDLWRLTGAK